ncbi:predicted protein [Pyrenophora tritici-repentis Pt-1C-BFP]|uniref:Uncharacterized protein n=1 Tax=Pyrenophora tritici-repentis (strain Pt-1C-BFP) TaxID=426418 RepID=B2WPS2_PYRTR|nr:uncharacterized protein PTRG_11982 [Pyrenophora tritici-repentis Pt-1C-BFP]EDU46138.1 predicted protein [Pyrenophora tritici-repentis Pt-1C-BFP]
MVKWYFIAAGIAKDCVLRETKAYPERLRSALEYIAKRMGAASVRAPIVGYERQTEPKTTSEEQLNNPSNAVDAPELRGTKRTAEDAEFEDLTKIVSQVLTGDQNLKDQINDIDKQIEQLQTQRRDLVEKRKDAKRRFKRQTLAIASRTDG